MAGRKKVTRASLTCAHSRRRGPHRQLCKSCLHNSPDSAMSHRSRSWTSSPTWPVARPALLPPNAALLRCHRPEGVPFESAFIGQINRYLLADGDLLRHPDDKPTIGLLFCKTKNRVVAESALSGMAKRNGVSEYQLVRALPEPLDVNLPSIEEIEAELADEMGAKDE